MIDRVKHNAGFTLAELLLSIAIIMVLAAIAIPSIVTAQNNMRMVELNNAAQSIANAAQTQMTAMKVSGTWLALVEDADGKVQYPASSTSTDTDTYYMVADSSGKLKGARDNGVVPGLSIDDAVCRGDFVIVFKASTASVVEVFYADGKTGFFGEAPESTNAAQSYYAGGSGNTAQAARMANDPMIGYYQGAPAGATDAVALENPVIWVDERGRLCVQDPNLSTNADAKTTTEIVVSLPGGASLTLSGLDGSARSYAISSGENTALFSNSSEKTHIYDLSAREGSTEANTYVIDLNDLKSMLKDSDFEAVLDELSTSKQTLDVHVEVAPANVTTFTVTAKADARIEWPEKVATLTVLVTNPALDAKNNGGKSSASHISGTYVDPQTELITDSGDNPVTGLSMKQQEKVFELAEAGIETSPILQAENIESSRQSYSGGWVKLADAVSQADPDEHVNVYAQVTAGSYTSNKEAGVDVSSMRNPGTVEHGLLWSNGGVFMPSGNSHAYQVYEIWINGERAGYLRQGEWVWEETDLGSQFSPCVDPITSNSTELKINLSKLYENVPQDADGYEVYVRTTPNADEVRQYFADNMSRIKDYFVGKSRTTGMRGVNLGAPIRQPFENEFGASSTVGLYNITSSAPTDTYASESVLSSGNSYFGNDDIRIYYSATTAIAWKDGAANDSVYTEAPSAQLWGFKKSDQYKSTLPGAYVTNPRSSGVPYALTSTTSADFELSTARDGLFYRILDYRDESGNRIDGLGLQYVPYSVQGNGKYASIADGPSKVGSSFSGWDVGTDSTWQSDPFKVASDGKMVADYESKLKYGMVKLTASYAALGLMYLEFDTVGALSGYYGYLSSGNGSAVTKDLTSTQVVDSWGYYVVVPEGRSAPTALKDSVGLTGEKVTIKLNDANYDAYRLASGSNAQKQATQKVSYAAASNGITQTGTFSINLNFAAAIALGDGNAQTETTTNVNGEAMPAWNVRHADQFVGALQGLSQSESEKIVRQYVGDSFHQTCDIDMAQRSVRSGVFSNDGEGSVFRGIYDGGDCNIWNAHVNSINSKRVQIAGESTSTRGSSVLFPRVAGTLSDEGTVEKACLKNIHMREDLSGYPESSYVWNWDYDDSFTNIGLLAGSVSQSVLSNCSIEGIASKDDYVASISIVQKSANISGWGILVGRAQDSELTGLKANNIKLISSGNNESVKWGTDVCFGSIVGYALNTNIEKSEATEVMIGTKTQAYHAYQGRIMSAGGLVGYLDGSSGLDECSVTNVKLQGPANQVDEKNKLIAGALAGRENTTGEIKNSTYKNVILVRDGLPDIVLEASISIPENVASPDPAPDLSGEDVAEDESSANSEVQEEVPAQENINPDQIPVASAGKTETEVEDEAQEGENDTGSSS